MPIYNVRNTQLLELSKCRRKIYGLNIALFKVRYFGVNCQIISRKQNHVIVVSALKYFLFKKCTHVKTISNALD